MYTSSRKCMVWCNHYRRYRGRDHSKRTSCFPPVICPLFAFTVNVGKLSLICMPAKMFMGWKSTWFTLIEDQAFNFNLSQLWPCGDSYYVFTLCWNVNFAAHRLLFLMWLVPTHVYARPTKDGYWKVDSCFLGVAGFSMCSLKAKYTYRTPFHFQRLNGNHAEYSVQFTLIQIHYHHWQQISGHGQFYVSVYCMRNVIHWLCPYRNHCRHIERAWNYNVVVPSREKVHRKILNWYMGLVTSIH